jgi:hypothetical protein
LETLSRLSSVLRSQGRYGEAETLLKKEVEVWQKFVGDDNPRTFDASIRLSRTIRFQGRLSAAEKLSREMVKWRRYINHNKQKQLWDLTFVTVMGPVCVSGTYSTYHLLEHD